MTEQEALREIARQALRLEAQTGLPAEVTAAQASLESNRLRRAEGNNCFGMKAVSRHKDRQLLRTREWFAKMADAQRWAAAKEGREIVGKSGQATTYGDGIVREEYFVRDWFARFATLDESFDDYGWLITRAGTYSAAWKGYLQHKDWHVLLEGIARKYATSSWQRYVKGALVRIAEIQPFLDEMRNASPSVPVAG